MILSQSAKDVIIKNIFQKKLSFPNIDHFIRMSIGNNGTYQTYFDYEKKDNDIIFDFGDFFIRIEESLVDTFKNIKVNYEEVKGLGFMFVVSNIGTTENECSCIGECLE